MKILLFAGLLLASLSGCSKGGSDPAPVVKITDGRWEWESEIQVTDLKNGQPTTTLNMPVLPGSVYYTYGTNGYLTVTLNGVAQTPVAYTSYQVGVPVVTTDKGFPVTTTLTELTATHMTQVTVYDQTMMTYTVTDTWKR